METMDAGNNKKAPMSAVVCRVWLLFGLYAHLL